MKHSTPTFYALDTYRLSAFQWPKITFFSVGQSFSAQKACFDSLSFQSFQITSGLNCTKSKLSRRNDLRQLYLWRPVLLPEVRYLRHIRVEKNSSSRNKEKKIGKCRPNQRIEWRIFKVRTKPNRGQNGYLFCQRLIHNNMFFESALDIRTFDTLRNWLRNFNFQVSDWYVLDPTWR